MANSPQARQRRQEQQKRRAAVLGQAGGTGMTMSAKEIIVELEKMSVEEWRGVQAALLRLLSPFRRVNPLLAERTAGELESEAKSKAGRPKRKLSEVLLEFAGTAEGLPEDMSVNHDHYLYGTPKLDPRTGFCPEQIDSEPT